jgi:hypothetical protein
LPRVDRVPADAQQLLDVRLLDAGAADLDLDAGDGAGETRGRIADECVVDIDSGDPLGLLTASRIVASVRSMSAMKPRRTPRLSRWPVPRILSSPPPALAISAHTLDEPISSAVTSLRAGGGDVLFLKSGP